LAKRRRVGDSDGDVNSHQSSQDEEEESQSSHYSGLETKAHDGSDDEESKDDSLILGIPEPAIQSSLPPVKSDRDAIEEYETMRASQVQEDEADTDEGTKSVDKRQWVRGKSSIYVDAFNLALDTVLEDEAHLFDEKEREVFSQWQNLSYESQYL
jgi:Fanconi-associated nuclease 1